MGLHDELGNSCSIVDLDNGGRECDSSENEVFRQAYDVMIQENERHADLCIELKNQLKNMAKPIVYLEGETDEKYFKKALEVFGYDSLNIEFKWIGHISENGIVEFTGKDSMNKAITFLEANRPSIPNIFLFDCDTNKEKSNRENIIVMCIPKYNSKYKMNKGIENALKLDELSELEVNGFYGENKRDKDYGGTVINIDLDKKKMCNYICGLDVELQKNILSNLKIVIDDIINELKR